ncbi:MAG TPA: cytochrome c [Terriglobia bacterium]|nr:cytochrome c [Terriglobia bacterium]
MDRPSGMLRPWFLAILAVIALLGMVAVRLRRQGLSARSEPSALEQFAAGKVRRWAIPVAARRLPNPLPATHETLQQGKEHWADHCATCHANDGSGDTEMGRNLYPRAPDMRKPATQSLSDGELYYIIRNGVPLTGMPAWGDPSLGHADMQTWALVSFIRHLPALSPEEVRAMEKLNPKTAAEREEEQAEEDFLTGGSPAPTQHQH